MLADEQCDACGEYHGSCPECVPSDAEINAFVDAWACAEPADDPKPNELLPDPETLPMELVKPNMQNVERLHNGFVQVVDIVRKRPEYGRVTEVDLLTALQQILRSFVNEQVVERAKLNATAAVVNRVAILHMLETLNDEILHIVLPAPKVN